MAVSPGIGWPMARERGQVWKPVVDDVGIVAPSKSPECIGNGEGWVDRRPPGDDPALARIVNLEGNMQKLHRLSHTAGLLRMCGGCHDCRMGLTPGSISRPRAKHLPSYCRS